MPDLLNYDDNGLVIRVDPDVMFQLAHVDMKNHSRSVMDAISGIVNVWQGLALGWVGKSAAEAQDFNVRWKSAVDQLFGSDKDPGSGALPRLTGAVMTAAINYGEAEDTNKKMFDDFVLGSDLGDALGRAAQNGSGTAYIPPPTRNDNNGPVTENAPPPPQGGPPAVHDQPPATPPGKPVKPPPTPPPPNRPRTTGR